jgi:hypothetical protein
MIVGELEERAKLIQPARWTGTRAAPPPTLHFRTPTGDAEKSRPIRKNHTVDWDPSRSTTDAQFPFECPKMFPLVAPLLVRVEIAEPATRFFGPIRASSAGQRSLLLVACALLAPPALAADALTKAAPLSAISLGGGAARPGRGGADAGG